MRFETHGRGKDCGPRGGGWSRGPFSLRWEIHDGPGEGRGGRQRRMFDGNELRLLLLMLIADEPRHGYDLIREIEARTNGAYAPSPGVVYPTITLLADMGLIEERASEGAKKLFAVTPAGEAHLAENAEIVVEIVRRITEIGAMREKTDGGPVRRAMGNLRSALRDRLMRDDVDGETLHDVAAILDEAVQKIERLK